MTYKIEVTNITYNRLQNYFPNAKNMNECIRELFKIALSPDKTLQQIHNAHRNPNFYQIG